MDANLDKCEDKWDKPLGLCRCCGAPLNEYSVGGYRLHTGEFGVSAMANYHIKYLNKTKEGEYFY